MDAAAVTVVAPTAFTKSCVALWALASVVDIDAVGDVALSDAAVGDNSWVGTNGMDDVTVGEIAVGDVQ